MNNTVKLAVATTGVAVVAYESLRGMINECVEKYIPEPVVKYVTPLVTGGVVLTAVGVGLSYAGIDVVAAARALSSVTGATKVPSLAVGADKALSLVVNPPGGDIDGQVITSWSTRAYSVLRWCAGYK